MQFLVISKLFVLIKYKMVSLIKLCYNIQYTNSIYSLIALFAKHASTSFFVLINRYSTPITTQQLQWLTIYQVLFLPDMSDYCPGIIFYTAVSVLTSLVVKVSYMLQTSFVWLSNYLFNMVTVLQNIIHKKTLQS